MGAAAVDRVLAGKKSRHNKARWPKKFRMLRTRSQEYVAAIREECEARAAAAEKRADDLQRVVTAYHANGMAVVEVVEVKQRGFLGRLAWATRFARTGKLDFERVVPR
jgi:hypothetical protein